MTFLNEMSFSFLLKITPPLKPVYKRGESTNVRISIFPSVNAIKNQKMRQPKLAHKKHIAPLSPNKNLAQPIKVYER